MERIEADPLYTEEAKIFINDFFNFKKSRLKDKNVVEKYMEYIKKVPTSAGTHLDLLSELTQRFVQPEEYVKYLNKLLDENPFYYKPENKYMLIDDFEDYRLQHLEQYNPSLVEKYSKQLYPETEAERKEIIKKYNRIKKYKDYIKFGGTGDIIKEIDDLKREMTDFNSRNIDKFKFPESIFKNLDYYKENIIIQKPVLRVSQPDNYFSYNPTYNYTLSKNYNTLSIEPLQEDNITLSKANKKLQDDYNALSIAKNQLEEENKQLQEDYNKKLNENKARYKNNLKLLEEDYNERVKNIIDDANNQIEELKKKNELAIDKGAEFEVNNKKMSDIDIQTTSPTQSNKNIQTSLPSLYITEFRETYNQPGDYSKRVEAIQKNANKKVNVIKNIYKQAKEDLIDEYNNLTNQLKEEYRNKKIRQNEYFEIPSKEQPEDNNTTNEFVLTNNKDMAEINPQMTSPQTIPLDQKITPTTVIDTPQPQEDTGKEEEEKTEEPPSKDIVEDVNINEEEEDKPEEVKPIEEEKKEEKKIIPIEKVSDELAKVIDSFYIQDKPIEETFGKLEETINNIPDEVFYTIMPYISSALANITVGGQKVFNDEAEVQELLLKIKNPNKINKRYKLPKKLDKAITQSPQRHLTISPMLLRNRKQTNINKNIYQY